MSIVLPWYTEAISLVVEKHGLGIFYLYPDDVFPKVVKDFYAHITSLDNAFIYVSGTSVLFDEDLINAQYGLSEGPNKHADFVKTVSPERLAQVLTDVCVEVGQKINVGKIIFLEIHRCAQKYAGRLNFPSLITVLCQKVKLLWSQNENHLPKKWAITTHNAQKLACEEMTRQTATPPSSPSRVASITPLTSHTEFEQRMIKAVEGLKQHFCILEKHHKMIVTDFGKAQEEMAIFCGYVHQYDIVIQDEDPTTAPTHNQDLEKDKARIESIHIKSDDDRMDTTQTSAHVPQSKASMTTQERAVIDEITKSDTDDDEEEVSINQLKRKRLKKVADKTVHADSDDHERPQRYKRTTRKSTQPK
ncbi:hypothetical protein PVK06_028017 [Gossypium arboreum]|uniref:Uncharacterized protein n=1 Tax=Gossypium arboreum TaxID=29729 RepID=A0ABR0P1X4_GOSAR|nr:hypothetical protein PVK06_028017 [Gossypium arboreum]